jgi:hypothetical protein
MGTTDASIVSLAAAQGMRPNERLTQPLLGHAHTAEDEKLTPNEDYQMLPIDLEPTTAERV